MAFTDGFLYHTQAFCSVQAVEFVIKHGPGSFTSVLTEMDSLTGVIRLTNCWGGVNTVGSNQSLGLVG